MSNEQALRALVESWRYRGKTVNQSDEEAVRDECADELEAALTAHARPVDEACGLLAEAAKVLDSNGIAWALARDLERAALTSSPRNDVGVTGRARIAHLTAVLGRIAKMGGPAAESARLALADEDDALVLEEREQPAQAPPAAVDALRAWVAEMKTSAGSRFYVCVGRDSGDPLERTYLTPVETGHRNRAEYHAAEWNHLLGHCPEPDILAFPDASAPHAQDTAPRGDVEKCDCDPSGLRCYGMCKESAGGEAATVLGALRALRAAIDSSAQPSAYWDIGECVDWWIRDAMVGSPTPSRETVEKFAAWCESFALPAAQASDTVLAEIERRLTTYAHASPMVDQECANCRTDELRSLRDWLTHKPMQASEGAEPDYTDIANRAQAATGYSIWPSTVKAILAAARATQEPSR